MYRYALFKLEIRVVEYARWRKFCVTILRNDNKSYE